MAMGILPVFKEPFPGFGEHYFPARARVRPPGRVNSG